MVRALIARELRTHKTQSWMKTQKEKTAISERMLIASDDWMHIGDFTTLVAISTAPQKNKQKNKWIGEHMQRI